MSDCRGCLISAKRAVGSDRHLHHMVEGWVAQMSDVCDGDVRVLAAKGLKG